jgi:hypothetical protein
MADNALAKQVGKKLPERRKTRLEQLYDELEAYGGRVRDDFLAGAERSAQGLGDIVERGDVLTGIPRLALGGTAWMSAPVSAALSPVLGPILQPVGEAVNTYVGQPVEDLTGYPADITNDLAMTGLTLGAAKGLGMTRPYLARAADQVEGMANRAGYTLRKPANVYGSGPTLTPLVDEADNGLTRTAGGVSSGNAPGPNAGEAIDATNLAFRVHPTDSQVAGSMKPGAAFSDISHKPLAAALEKGGFKVARIERSASNTETFGPSLSQYLDVEAPNGTKFKVRLSDHSYVPRDGQVDLRYGMSPEEMQLQLMRQSGMDVPRALSDAVAKQAADADAARIAAEQLKAQQFADEYRPKIDKALADVIAKKGEAKVLEKWDLVKRQAPGARAARQALEAWGVPPDVLAALQKLK